MKYPFFFIVLLGLSWSLFAQKNPTISGVITNAENGEQMTSATLLLVHTTTQKVYTASTNNYGFYSVVVPQGTYQLTISAPGYQPLDTTLHVNSVAIQYTTELHPAEQALEEVVVQSYSKRIATTEVSSREVVVAQIKRLPVVLGEPDILKTLQLLPGITSTGDATVGFNVRGGNSDQNWILLDEAPLFNPSHVFGLFSAFNSDAIRSFKLYKGGIPARYGGRASSVLDVRQFEGNNKAYTVDGSLGLLSAGVAVQGPIYKKKSLTQANNSFFIAGRRSYFDLFLALSGDEKVKKTILYFYDLNLKVNWKPSKNNQLFLSAYLGNDNFGFGNLFSYGWGNVTSTFRWNHVYSDRTFSNISLVYSNYTYRIGMNAEASSFDWKGEIYNLFLKGSWEYKLNNSNTFFAGFVSSFIHTKPGTLSSQGTSSSITGFSSPDERGLESAAYVEWIKKISPRFSFHAGVRLNWFARFGPEKSNLYANDQPVTYLPSVQKYISATPIGSVERTGLYYNNIGIDPRLNATYVVRPWLSVKASYNRLHQYMQLVTNNSTPTPTDIYRIAGTYMKPLVVDQVSLGAVTNIPVKQKNIETTVEFFVKNFQGVIDYIDGANLLFNSHIEKDLLPSDAFAYGAEFMIEKTWGRWTGWISYTFSSSQFIPKVPTAGGPGINRGKAYSTPYNLPHNFSFVTDFKFTERIHASLTFVLRSGKPATYPTTRYMYDEQNIPFYGARNEFRAPLYHRLDVSVTFEGKQRKHFKSDWVISIYNLYNRKNVFSYVFNTDRMGSVETPQVQRLSIYGIVPSISWQFKIK